MLRRLANILLMTVLLLGPALLLHYCPPATDNVDQTDARTETAIYIPTTPPR